jgi:hypothetical protein
VLVLDPISSYLDGERWDFKWQGDRDVGGEAPALGWWGWVGNLVF